MDLQLLDEEDSKITAACLRGGLCKGTSQEEYGLDRQILASSGVSDMRC